MKKTAFLVIGVSLAFAALMLLSAWTIKDESTRQTVVFMLIAAWWIPFSILIGKNGRSGSCC